jgi:hypothetical protein
MAMRFAFSAHPIAEACALDGNLNIPPKSRPISNSENVEPKAGDC